MISRLLTKFRKSPEEPISPHIPDNERIYCIGDIHGCAHLLQQLHEKIITDTSDYPGKKTIIYLGDYIDRGEDSQKVIEMLVSNPLPGFEPVYLQGNHEQAILSFIEFPEASAAWVSFGGREALNSYGIPLAHIPAKREIPELAKRLDNRLPDTHREFLQNCKYSYQCGSYYFVHAGIQPGITLDKQHPEDQLWIREEFLESEKNHGAIIVHGHSITDKPQLLPNRIGIDTGAFKTGVLTCLVLEGEKQRFLQTSVKIDSGSSPE